LEYTTFTMPEDGSSFIEFAQINVSEKQKNWYYVRNFRVNVGAVTNRALFPARDSIIEQWSQSNFEVVMQYQKIYNSVFSQYLS
jgi:hypothetical protein